MAFSTSSSTCFKYSIYIFCFSIQKALTEELIKGRLNAILDVTTPEPLENNSILWDLENVFLTPHIAGSMGNEVNKMSEFMIEEVKRFNNKQVLEGEIFIDDYDLLA